MALACTFSGSVEARGVQSQLDPTQVQYGSAPTWLEAPPRATGTETPAGAPYRVVYSDTQIRVMSGYSDKYSAYRVKILTPQALSIGALKLEWNPDSQIVTVNTLFIYRDKQTIDILASNRFVVLQREASLESSVLTGILTATMQIPGLEVGDEIEFAVTIRERDTVFGGHVYGADLMSLAEGAGANRVSLGWSPGNALRYQGSSDIPKAQAAPYAATWNFNDPGELQLTDGAPSRYNVRRLVEYSDFADWKQVSAVMYPLFEKAEILKPASPVAAEVKHIATQTNDPIQRTEAALNFVQENIRYVFVGLNGANFRPMNIDETWNNRFGDCKAKSVMLDAMLRQLGISSEIVLVNSQGGDDISSRLPSPLVFDHAIIRAIIDGRTYYLDATQYGNQILPLLEPTRYRAILPVEKGGAELEQPALKPPMRPTLIVTIDEDWRAGLDLPAKVTANRYVFGDNAAVFNALLSGLSPEQADRGLRAYWANEDGWLTPDSVSWRHDESRSAIVLTAIGTANSDWSGDAQSGHSNTIPHAGSYPPPERKRSSTQDQAVPWANEFPSYECAISNVHLPKPSSAQLRWNYNADPFDVRIGGIRYVRKSSMADGIVRTIRIHKTYLSEIDATAAAKANTEIPSFDNSMGRIFEENTAGVFIRPSTASKAVSGPLIDDVDWTQQKTACSLDD
jgi:hypothetical protein